MNAQTVISYSIQGDDLDEPVIRQLEEVSTVEDMIEMVVILHSAETKTIDFGDINFDVKTLIIFTNGPLVLDFGAPPPANLRIRSIYVATYKSLGLDYVHLKGDDLTGSQTATIRVIAIGDRIPV